MHKYENFNLIPGKYMVEIWNAYQIEGNHILVSEPVVWWGPHSSFPLENQKSLKRRTENKVNSICLWGMKLTKIYMGIYFNSQCTIKINIKLIT